MTPTVRNPLILAFALLIAACTRVGHIMQKEPIRTMSFSGSHKQVAACVTRRLGGKIQQDGLSDERYTIYDAVKGQSSEGLTHWAITVGRYRENEGFAEWRIVTPPATGRGPTTMPIDTPLSDTAVKTYWGTVEECARQASKSS